MIDVLDRFHPIVADWFRRKFGTPTEPQQLGWPAILSKRDTLIAAPTGSGKTLAAFLACLDDLIREGLVTGGLADRTRVLYISPLKALSNDIQKNLDEPLRELKAHAAQQGLRLPDVRTAVRTGDTPAAARAAMLRKPPHILITTPESFYLLLTSDGGRRLLALVSTVIVDEIHAVARDKRGAHLALSLERLDALVAGGIAPALHQGGTRPVRIGLSATQEPVQEIARYLVGAPHVDAEGAPRCTIIDVGHSRPMDLAVDVPRDPLGAVATMSVWSGIQDRVAELIRTHRSTLVFVNTRRLVERVTHALADRVGAEAVAAHHGSLSRATRLDAEHRLKTGQLKAVVATASLELGIDVGSVDLVCQLGSPRAFAVGLQRIGRSGHWRGATPKGRLFPVTRDELVECAAFVRGVRAGRLERTIVPEWPRDVLCQQIVAESAVGAEPIDEDALFTLFRRAWPYRSLPREEYDALVAMLADGIATARGRRGAWLFRDGIHGRVKGRRGARQVAIGNAGAIPDTTQYAVVKEPEGVTIGLLDEDFAVESLAGDIFLLGNTSWRILRIESGRVRVEDAKGAPPNIPFWNGEAPGRSFELSREVGALRAAVEPMAADPDAVSRWLREECALSPEAAVQTTDYLVLAKETLGRLPTQDVLIAERFFDEAGGMQLVVHAPFGMKINRAFGLAMRKRFCASFDFELQAAATDEGILLSLGPQHSFPLESVFAFLHPSTLKETLEQAVLAAPMFGVRWRWTAQRSLAVLRAMNGRKTPPPILRMRVDDLLAACFPAQAGCQENVVRPIPIPDHPLVQETMRDLFTEAMNVPALEEIVGKMARRELTLVARDTPTPSPLSHEILNSNPYAYLDDAPLEERRARAVVMRRALSAEDLQAFGALDAEAIHAVVDQAAPDVRNSDEMHDLLLTLGLAPEHERPSAEAQGPDTPSPYPHECVEALISAGCAFRVRVPGVTTPFVAAAERLAVVLAAYPDATVVPRIPARKEGVIPDREEAITKIVQGWMTMIGPVTADALAMRLGLPRSKIDIAFATLEGCGNILRGSFRAGSQDGALEWCDRDLLARIHRRCLTRLRAELQPVPTADFMRFLLRWQHAHPGSQVHGSRGLAEVIAQLQGLQLPVAAWESAILPARVAEYEPAWLDELCLSGQVAWGRLVATRPGALVGPLRGTNGAGAVPGERDLTGASPFTAAHRRGEAPMQNGGPASRRQSPNRSTTITLVMRDDLPWLLDASRPEVEEPLGEGARHILDLLTTRGALFFNEIQVMTRRLNTDLEQALWELLAGGHVTCDGFSGLRLLVDPEKRRIRSRFPYGPSRRAPAAGGGRWSLLRPRGAPLDDASREDWLEALAGQYLRRYGVVFRDVLTREVFAPSWRTLLAIYRRGEARGELRAGRFVDGVIGEQFALPEAIDALRAVRKTGGADERVTISSADPLNLAGIIVPGTRISAVFGHHICFEGGAPLPLDGEAVPEDEEQLTTLPTHG